MQCSQNSAEPHPKYLLAGVCVCVCVCVCAMSVVLSGVEMRKTKEKIMLVDTGKRTRLILAKVTYTTIVLRR